MVANKIAKLKLGSNQHGKEGRSIDLPSTSQAEAAKTMNVSVPSVKRARKVREHAVPDIVTAVERGATRPASEAASVARHH